MEITNNKDYLFEAYQERSNMQMKIDNEDYNDILKRLDDIINYLRNKI